VRNRSGSQRRTRSPITETEGDDEESPRTVRKRSQPPSRHRIEDDDGESAELRRQRSYHKLHEARRDSKGEDSKPVDSLTATQGSVSRAKQLV
jgi:hypothetical protein